MVMCPSTVVTEILLSDPIIDIPRKGPFRYNSTFIAINVNNDFFTLS